MGHWIKPVFSASLTVVMLGAAVPASAQDTPKVEVSGGYQYIFGAAVEHGDPGRFTFPIDEELEKFQTFNKGWYADVAGNLRKMVAVVFSVGGNYKTLTVSGRSVDVSVHEFMGGLRVNWRNPMVVPFGQVLVGGVRLGGASGAQSLSQTNVGVEAGAGVNVMPGGKVGLRLGGDYLFVKGKSGAMVFHQNRNGFRFVVGIVVATG